LRHVKARINEDSSKMPELIKNYQSQPMSEILRKQASKAWSIGFAVVLFWVFLIILAPAVKYGGLETLSNVIYKFFSVLCHQMPERSFHLFGHQFAVCSRCFGVYFGLVFGFLVYPLFRKIEETEPFPRYWLFLSLVPIGVDWSLGVFGIWENTHLSRFLTGLILGTACAVFIIPAIVELGQVRFHKKRFKTISD
jgi:uncharacterized membrane protein